MSGQKDALDSPEATHETPRPLPIKIACLTGLILSLFEIAGNFYSTHIIGDGFENKWTIYLKVIPFVNIVCWIGFWKLRRATLILYILNISFSLWVVNHIGGALFDFYSCVYILIAIIMVIQLKNMTRFI